MLDLTRDDLLELKADLRGYIGERCDRIEKQLDEQNGRVREAEGAIAVLQDRSTRPGVAAATGGGAGLVAMMAWEWIKARIGHG